MDNVHKHSTCISVPSSQTFRSYLVLLLSCIYSLPSKAHLFDDIIAYLVRIPSKGCLLLSYLVMPQCVLLFYSDGILYNNGRVMPSPLQTTFHKTKNYTTGSVYYISNKNTRIKSYLLQCCYPLQRHTYTVVLLEPGTCRSSNLNWNIWVGKWRMQGCDKQHNIHPTWHSNTTDPSYFLLRGMRHGLVTTFLSLKISNLHTTIACVSYVAIPCMQYICNIINF
jgi:hypothetical protein